MGGFGVSGFLRGCFRFVVVVVLSEFLSEYMSWDFASSGSHLCMKGAFLFTSIGALLVGAGNQFGVMVVFCHCIDSVCIVQIYNMCVFDTTLLGCLLLRRSRLCSFFFGKK